MLISYQHCKSSSVRAPSMRLDEKGSNMFIDDLDRLSPAAKVVGKA